MAIFFSFVVVYITVQLNNILLLITRGYLSITQASSSFKCFDACTFMYAMLTFITEALLLVTRVKLL